MTDEILSELLERAADRVSVSAPPPTVDLRRTLRRQQRRRSVAAGVAGVLVVGVVALTYVVTKPADDRGVDPAPAPIGPVTQYGFGRYVVDVPASWAVDDEVCGIPQRDTVLVDLDESNTFSCFVRYPEHVSAVRIRSGLHYDVEDERGPLEDVEVDGVPAQRSATTCSPKSPGSVWELAEVCSISLYFPEDDGFVAFTALTTEGRARAEALLSGVHARTDRIGIPDPLDPIKPMTNPESFAPNSSGLLYAARLRELGLNPEIKRRPWRQGTSAGDFVDVSPAVGRVVDAGSTVTVTVGGAPPGPAGQVLLDLTTTLKGGSALSLQDRELRGRTKRLGIRVGTAVDYSVEGALADEVLLEIDGDSVGYEPLRSLRGPPLFALKKGRSTVRFVLTVDGERTVLATLVLIVR